MKTRVVSLFLALTVAIGSAAFAEDAKSEAVLKPGDNLVVEGIPPVGMDLVDKADRYTNFRSAALSDWHPEKRQILINTRFADTVQVHEVGMPLGARTQQTFFRDSARGGTYQPVKSSKYLIFTKDKGGDEFFQKYRLDFDTKDVSLITDGKSRNVGETWSNAGNLIAYASTRRNGNDMDIYIENPADPKSDKMVAQCEGGGWEPQSWSPDDKSVVLIEEISANESYLWLMDAKTGEKTALTPRDAKEKVHYTNATFSKDGKGIYLSTDKDSEFERLAYMDLQTKQLKYYTSEIKWDVSEVALSWDGKRIAFTTNEDGRAILHFFDTKTETVSAAPTNMPAGQVGGLQWHRNNQDLGFVVDSAKSPGDVYSLNVESGKIDRWTVSETGGVLTASNVEPELLHWKSFDDKSISGFLYKPAAKFTGKRPVVINIHGGPEGQSRPGFLGRNNYLLNELGVAIIFPNIRGSLGYGKTFSQLDNGKLRQDTYKDIDALLDYIKTRPDLDSDRVMVMGGSYGGHMTLAIATFYSDKIRCAMDIVGPSNLVTFLENTQGYRRDLRRVEYGDERDKDMRAFLEKIAPSNNAEKIKKTSVRCSR